MDIYETIIDRNLSGGSGGGGLEYVVPEQTVTFQNDEATVQNINTSLLENGTPVVAKIIIISDEITTYVTGLYDDNEISFSAYFPVGLGSIDTTNGVWYLEDAEDNMQITISAVTIGF